LKIEVVGIGSELLRYTLNTNLISIAQYLESISMKVSKAIIVPDDHGLIVSSLGQSLGFADIVIVTGGLGPTFDDITKEAVADVLGKPLVYSQDLMDTILEYCNTRHLSIPDSVKRMAYVIEDSKVLPNKHGSACGLICKTNSGKMVILLPGPPFEMNPMFQADVIPYLKKNVSAAPMKRFIIKVGGLPEVNVEEIVKPVIEAKYKDVNVTFSILVNYACIYLRGVVSADNYDVIDTTIDLIQKKYVFSFAG